MTRGGLSYKSVFFYSATIPRETFYFAKSFAVVQEEGTAEGLSDKEPTPPRPEIQNSTAPTSAPEDPIEAGIVNASNWAEDIALVRNQGLEVDDDMETSPKNFPLVDTSAADTLLEEQTWGGWDGIDRRAVVAQNQN